MAAPKSVLQLMDGVSDGIAARRRTLRVLETPRFQMAYAKADDDARTKAAALVSEDDQVGLEHWIRAQLQQEYSAMPIRELRETGRKFGITNYARLPPARLLSEILSHARSAGYIATHAHSNA